MSHQYQCLQGHAWVYDEGERELAGRAMFCPTCGLRLFSDSQAPTIPTSPQEIVCEGPGSISFNSGDALRLTRGSKDSATPIHTIQPNEIEAIPGYELLGVLGRGGMGIVFRARQLSLKRQVALKMILTGRHARSTDRARFQREAEAVARLQHPNIVQIHEVGEQNGLPYFSLEFVNAGSLAQFLGGNPQSPRITAQFVHDLAQAMHYAHKRDIVHRDLKPANILLHLDESQILKDGQMADSTLFQNLTAYVPKITDFGLAKRMGGEEGPFRHGAVVGTPSYMAPEQARGTSGEVGPLADVYALGAILYEMLTGRPPFQAATVEETAHQVLTMEPIAPTQFQPRIPKDLETICLVCLQKNPEHRYGSAEALAEDLRRFLENEPILARRTHLSERVVKWAIRRPRPLLTGMGLALLLLTSFFWYVSWRRAITIQAERDQLLLAWQRTEEQLQQATQTIDQMAAAETDVATLLKAKQFYDRSLQHESSPARQALVFFRLAKVQERLGEQHAAQASYQEAISRWEKLCHDRPERFDYQIQLTDGRQRMQALARRAGP